MDFCVLPQARYTVSPDAELAPGYGERDRRGNILAFMGPGEPNAEAAVAGKNRYGKRVHTVCRRCI